MWAGLVALGVEQHQRPIEELLVVIGPRRSGLPLSEHAPADLHMCVVTIEDAREWARGNPNREEAIAGLRKPLPEGRAWTLAAWVERGGLMVTLFNHDVVEPSQSMLHHMRLALVPPDGGECPGRLLTARGGSA